MPWLAEAEELLWVAEELLWVAEELLWVAEELLWVAEELLWMAEAFHNQLDVLPKRVTLRLEVCADAAKYARDTHQMLPSNRTNKSSTTNVQ